MPTIFHPSLYLLLLLFLTHSVFPVQSVMDNYIWYFQGLLTQKCNRFNEYFMNYPLTPLIYKEIHTSLSYNDQNTSGIIALGYGLSCPFSRSREIIFDRSCDDTLLPNALYPLGYIMYNPDIRYNQWICLGEESRIARYHASYATVARYRYVYSSSSSLLSTETNNNNYPLSNELLCSTVCVIGGQQIFRQPNTTIVDVEPTTTVLCLRIDITYGGTATNKDEPIYTMQWYEAEPLPYPVVGASAIHSNGTLFVIGGIRGNYDDTTSSILEADIDPNTCLPYNWRNYGYSSTSRIGNQKLVQNWTSNDDRLTNRTFLWTTEGPPAYPKLSGEIIYENVPRIYTPSYFPSVLVGGGITVPRNLDLNPSTYSIANFYTTESIQHDNNYYIPLQYLPLSTGITSSSLLYPGINLTLYTTSQRETQEALIIARNPALPINLNLPAKTSIALEYIVLLDRTRRPTVRDKTNPSLSSISSNTPYREYRWLFYDGTYMYFMDTNGDMLNPWQLVFGEIIQLYDSGDYASPKDTMPAGANILVSLLGRTKDSYIIGTDYFTFASYMAYDLRCTRCETGVTYSSKPCKFTPYEGICRPCSVCSPFNNPSTYLVSTCTRETNSKCAKCTQCFGGPPLQTCNLTTDAECNPELEALMVQPKWKRVPILITYDIEYMYIVSSIVIVWLGLAVIYNINKTQVNLSPRPSSSTGMDNNGTAKTNVLPSSSVLSGIATISASNTTVASPNGVTFREIMFSSLFRRNVLSLLQNTGIFLWGTLTIVSFLFFNYAVLSTVRNEENNSTIVFSNPSFLYMGNLLRDKIKTLCIVTLCSLSLSVIFNYVWLLRYYRSISNIPLVYYIVLPILTLHYHLSMGFYKYALVSLLINMKSNPTTLTLNNTTNSSTVTGITTTTTMMMEPTIHTSTTPSSPSSNSNNNRTKFGDIFLHFLSIFCSDGMMVVMLLTLSDMFSATISSSYPLTVGVAICGLFNILLSIYKLCLVYGIAAYTPQHILKNEETIRIGDNDVSNGGGNDKSVSSSSSYPLHNPINKGNSKTVTENPFMVSTTLPSTYSSLSIPSSSAISLPSSTPVPVPSGVTYSFIPLSSLPTIPLPLNNSVVPSNPSVPTNTTTSSVPLVGISSSSSSSSSLVGTLPLHSNTNSSATTMNGTTVGINPSPSSLLLQNIPTGTNNNQNHNGTGSYLERYRRIQLISSTTENNQFSSSSSILPSPTTPRLLHNQGFTYSLGTTATTTTMTNTGNIYPPPPPDYTAMMETVSDIHPPSTSSHGNNNNNNSPLEEDDYDGSNTLYDITL